MAEVEEEEWYYFIHSYKDNRIIIFPNGIIPKVKVIVLYEFEVQCGSPVR